MTFYYNSSHSTMENSAQIKETFRLVTFWSLILLYIVFFFNSLFASNKNSARDATL